MAVRVADILLRAGGATLKRLQTLVSAGAGRNEVAHTFTRATVKRAFRDRDGTARRASAGNMAIDWPTGLVDASGNAIGGPLSEGARTQLVTDPENFGAWTVAVVTRTAAQADPYGGTAAYLFTPTGGANSRVVQAVTYTGNGTKSILVHLRAGTSTRSRLNIQDTSAGVDRHLVNVDWAGGVPTLTTSASGAGQRFNASLWGGGWYTTAINADGIVAANVNQVQIYPDSTGANGTVYAFGANSWNASLPGCYHALGEATGVADALSALFNFGPTDITVLVRLARPFYGDASGALGVSPGIFSFGAGTAPRIGAYFDPAARNIVGVIDTATTDATQTVAIPAGQPTVSFQFKNLTTGGQVAIDTGSGLSAFSSAATAFSAFSSQTLRIGRYDDELYGVIGDLIVARGLQSRADMLAIA